MKVVLKEIAMAIKKMIMLVAVDDRALPENREPECRIAIVEDAT